MCVWNQFSIALIYIHPTSVFQSKINCIIGQSVVLPTHSPESEDETAAAVDGSDEKAPSLFPSVALSVVRQKAVHRYSDARIARKLDKPSMLVLLRLGEEMLVHGERQAPVVKLPVNAHLPNKAFGRKEDVT